MCTQKLNNPNLNINFNFNYKKLNKLQFLRLGLDNPKFYY